MNDIAIKVEHLSKMFKIYNKPSDIFWELVSGSTIHREFWALTDLSFTLERGKVIGFIGKNGAGKSTLLKILAGTMDSTKGNIAINGTITAILELGTGFHPDYSGRDNIYMGGMCFGMSRKEVDEKIDRIIEFSELGDVIDQPFRTYSSGMQGRLTFSTAMSVDPDILIVDEALSTGDARFQRKCFSLFERLREEEKTILFVSHDSNCITHLCDEVYLLADGKIIEQGDPRQVVKYYNKLLFSRKEEDQRVLDKSQTQEQPKEGQADIVADETRYGTKEVEIIDCGILNRDDQPVTMLESGRNYRIYVHIKFNKSLPNLTCGCRIVNIIGVDVFAANTSFHGIDVPALQPGEVLEIRFAVTMWLAPGDYFLTFGVIQRDSIHFCDRRMDTLAIKVVGRSTIDPACVADLNEEISLHPIEGSGNRDQETGNGNQKKTDTRSLTPDP
jgi:homopolymeric O-antigen transport system ATP-binding protein